MNTWILSLLLLLVVAFSLMFNIRERFEDAEPELDHIDLLHSSSKKKNRAFVRTPMTYSHDLTLTREFNTRPGLMEGFDDNRKHRCPECPTCPDMSKYIRLDEVPCWNCSLP